jgi:hypothetical protein
LHSATNTTLPVTLANATVRAEKQEWVRQKKKKELECVEEDTLLEEDTKKVPSTIADEEVGVQAIDNAVDDEDTVSPEELDSELGPYWTLAQSTQLYVLSTITLYSNIEASKSTPQYGFNRGLKEFSTMGYEATVKELDDNLLGMGAVRMLKPSEISKTIRFEALNYLIFLKRKQCGKIKARARIHIKR